MTSDHNNASTAEKDRTPSSAELASEPRSFVIRLAERMDVSVDEVIVRKLTDKIARGASREAIIKSLQNIKGERYPTDKAAAALNFARMGSAGEALIVENILSFSPNDEKAYVRYAYAQVLDRHPSTVELARLTHELEIGGLSRIELLSTLNETASSEGRIVAWDSAQTLLEHAGEGEVAVRVVESGGFRTISRSSPEVLTLCRFAGQQWELAPSMVSRPDEVRSDSWIVSDGFILTGPKSHLSEGFWVLELDIVQPDWASVVIDIVANSGIDRLLHLTIHGNLRGNFSFEKLKTHAFPEIRLRVQDSIPGQWISIQSVRLRKIG